MFLVSESTIPIRWALLSYIHNTFLYHDFCYNSNYSQKHRTYYTIHNSKDTATKYSIIRIETCEVILPGW